MSFDGRTVVGTASGQGFVWSLPTGEDHGAGAWFFFPASQAYTLSDDGALVAGLSTGAPGIGSTMGRDAIDGRNWLGGIPDLVPTFRVTDEFFWGPVRGLSGNGHIAVGEARTNVEEHAGFRPGEIVSTFYAEAVIWRLETRSRNRPQSLGVGYGSQANAVSRNGLVVVGTTPLDGRAFWWTEATRAEPIGDLPGGGASTYPWALSENGSVIVGSASSKAGTEAFLWTEAEGMTGLGDLPGGRFSSVARAVSADGTIVVGHGTSEAQGESPGGERAFLWDAKNGMRDLHTVLLQQGVPGEGLPKDFAKWRLKNAVAIRVTSEGHPQIAGTAIGVKGGQTAFVATLGETVAP